jgi:hypothetical protein
MIHLLNQIDETEEQVFQNFSLNSEFSVYSKVDIDK